MAWMTCICVTVSLTPEAYIGILETYAAIKVMFFSWEVHDYLYDDLLPLLLKMDDHGKENQTTVTTKTCFLPKTQLAKLQQLVSIVQMIKSV